MAHEKPTDQSGPICPYCKTKPALHYAVVDEIDDARNVYKIVYCEDCLCMLSMNFVGNLNAIENKLNGPKKPAITIAGGLDMTKIPPHLRRLKQ